VVVAGAGGGFGAVLTVTGVLARAPGHGTTATLGLVLLLLAAGAIVAVRSSSGGGEALRRGLPGRDRGRRRTLDPLRDQRPLGAARGRLQQRPRPPPGMGRVAARRAGPVPDSGYPLGPHAARGRDAALRASGSGRPSSARSSRSACSPA
jgi:hypothetical protein